MPFSADSNPASNLARYNRFLLLVAGMGGLLYGIDVGIIGGARPYLQATSRLTPSELSIIVAAVLLGSVISTLFAGLLADWLGRQPLMILSGLAFSLRVPLLPLPRASGGLARPQAAHDPQRPRLLAQRSRHRPLPVVRSALPRASATGSQRRPGRRCGSALPGRMPLRQGARTRHRRLPMAA